MEIWNSTVVESVLPRKKQLFAREKITKMLLIFIDTVGRFLFSQDAASALLCPRIYWEQSWLYL